jgi:hypothetical protein
MFFFASYEGVRLVQGNVVNTQVPTAAMKAGNLSASPTNIYDPLTGAANGTLAPLRTVIAQGRRAQGNGCRLCRVLLLRTIPLLMYNNGGFERLNPDGVQGNEPSVDRFLQHLRSGGRNDAFHYDALQGRLCCLSSAVHYCIAELNVGRGCPYAA